MNNLAIKEVDFQGDTLLACEKGDKLYVAVKWVCEGIGLSEGQTKSERKKVQEDLVISRGIAKFEVMTNGGKQKVLHLELKYLPIWLASINRKSLNNNQYTKLMKLLNWCLSGDFDEYKYPTKTFKWEAELRDEMFYIGYFNEYVIEDKELICKFGRIDLVARDKENNKIIIELKKDKNYNDVITQCKKYTEGFKKEFNEDVKVVICTLDDDINFINEAKSNGFEVYKYKRELKLEKIA